MNVEKQIKRVKLIYSGELLLFAVVFLVLGFLELFAVIKIKETFQLIFKIVTLVGATWLVFDFIWMIKSPKRRAKNCMLDKVMMLPLALYLYVYDILGFVLNPGYGYYQFGVPVAFIYIACVYIFQGIYHYYKPVPTVIEMIEEIQKPEEKPQDDVLVVDETPVEENKKSEEIIEEKSED